MKRNLSVDILKFVLSFLVVGLHVKIFADVNQTLSYLFVQGICRAAVPVFLVISGFYFYKVQTKKSFIEWIKRLFLLYLIWMLVYCKFWFRNDWSIIQSLLIGWYHLWYLIHALYAFLFLWIIRKIKTKWQVTLLIAFGLLGIILQYNYNYTDNISVLYYLGNHTYMNALFFCFPFIMMGYLIHKLSIENIITKKLPMLLIFGFVALMIESFINYWYCNKPFEILAMLYLFCPLLFIFVYKLEYYSKNKTNITFYSTGVYLIHILVWMCLEKFTNLSNTPMVIITFLLSISFTYFLVKIRKWIPWIL
jgi:surface polysaccharide O-acyltransferase-like enzyme